MPKYLNARNATSCAVVAAVLVLSLPAVIVGQESPYAGEETRAIKALSGAEVAAYLAGDGMGWAKAAELNGYPGPRHVLDMRQQLELSPTQVRETEAVFEGMQREARRLGVEIVKAERRLDAQFAAGAITEATLRDQTSEIADLQAALRAVHLEAHLGQREILSADQTSRYDQHRGYAGEGHAH